MRYGRNRLLVTVIFVLVSGCSLWFALRLSRRATSTARRPCRHDPRGRGALPLSPAHDVCAVGSAPWGSVADSRSNLAEFLEVYGKRPGGSNDGGGSLFHYFAIWRLIRALRPAHVVESGADKGIGTWFLRQAAGPDAQIVVVSPEHPRIYVDGYVDGAANSRYFVGEKFQDFAEIDWSFLDPARTLIFFDDHQAGLRRIKEARARDFRHLAFDDNYLPGCGDNFSPKKACATTNIHHLLGATYEFQDDFGQKNADLSPAQFFEAQAAFHDAVAVYAEFPPVWGPTPNRFGVDDEVYASVTHEPLFDRAEAAELCQANALDFDFEVQKYTHICYVQTAPGFLVNLTRPGGDMHIGYRALQTT
jgi:hypothetical protein